MIDSATIRNIIQDYDHQNIKIGVLGSHSALEIMDGAVDESMKTVCICQKGRETPYLRFNRLSDKVMILEKFVDIVKEGFQEQLRKLNVIMVAHRSFSVYLGYDNIENNFKIPLFGNRYLLRAEERNASKNQTYLLDKARIKHPRSCKSPSEISGPSIVKVQEAKRKIERAFFFVNSYKDYMNKSENKIKNSLINRSDLESAIIEEYIIGTYFNFNFFFSPLKEELEFLGIERRLQTNLHDFTSLTAKQQLELDIEIQNIEIGHTPASIRESMLEKVFELGDKFVASVRKEYPPGLIGPFSLQSVVTKDLDIYVYDVSFRVPGNPILSTTSPYTKYSYGFPIGVGRRIAMEIKYAVANDRLVSILT